MLVFYRLLNAVECLFIDCASRRTGSHLPRAFLTFLLH